MDEKINAKLDCHCPVFGILLLTVLLAATPAYAQDAYGTVPAADAPETAGSNDDGIIGSGELLDSPVLQTHGGEDRDATSDILSEYYLRDHITAQAEAFKYLGSEDGYYLAWPLPLSSQTRIVSYVTEKKVVRYNMVKTKVPRYDYDYDYVTRVVYSREGGVRPAPSVSSSYGDESPASPGTLGKLVKRTVTTREVVRTSQVGWTTAEVRQADPNGKYEEEIEIRRPVVKSSAIAVLPRGWYAANAQLAFTMIKVGLPAEDPQVKLIIRSFHNILYAYGIPDNTADVAWLLALYANLPGDDPHVKEWKPRLISRLVSGASQTGSHSGMWGAVCIHPGFVDELVESDARFGEKYLTTLQREVQMESNERKKRRLEQDYFKKEKNYKDWQKGYMTWAMAGSSVNFPRKLTTIPAVTERQKELFFSYSLQVPGLVHDPYHFQFTDLESTCLALFALSEAQASGGLPRLTLAPLDQKKKPLAKPIDIAATLRACHSTLRKLRLPDGGWNSCYSGTFHKLCRNIPYTSVLPKDLYDKIAPEESWSYRLMGIASMEYLARMIGGSTGQQIRKESEAVHSGLIDWLLGQSDAIDFGSAPGGSDLRYFLADLLSGRNPDARFLWQRIGQTDLGESRELVSLDVAEIYNSHSARASLAAEQEFFNKNAGLLDVWTMEAESADKLKMTGIRTLSERASITYLLAKGMRPPVFAAIRPTGARPSLPALDYLMNSPAQVASTNYFYVDSTDDIGRYITAYMLVMEDRGDLAFREDEKEKLAEYFSQGGTLILLGLPGKSSSTLEKMAADLLAGIGSEFRFAEGEKRGSRCVDYLVNDRPTIVVVDAAPEAEPKATYKRRLKVYQALMKEKLPEGYLSDSYSLLLGRTTSGELTLTGIDWNSGEEDVEE